MRYASTIWRVKFGAHEAELEKDPKPYLSGTIDRADSIPFPAIHLLIEDEENCSFGLMFIGMALFLSERHSERATYAKKIPGSRRPECLSKTWTGLGSIRPSMLRDF